MNVGWVAAQHEETHAAYRYRVKMPMAQLAAIGHEQAFYDEARHFDVVVFGRAYEHVHIGLAHHLKRKGATKTVLDLSDNHFYNPFGLKRYVETRQRLEEMIHSVSALICTTEALASNVRNALKDSAPPIHVIGDYCETAPVKIRRSGQSRPMLLWFGNAGSMNAPNGLADLHLIAEPLRRAWSEKEFDLVVCSSDRDRYAIELADLGVPSRFVPWTLHGFPRLLAAADAVLIPATRNPFVDAKSANRLTLSLLAGVPTLAAAIPSYVEFQDYCYLDNWDEGLQQVLHAPEKATARAMAGAEYMRQQWSDSRVTGDWLTALEKIAAPLSRAA